jgi:DNA-binding GntR family transcriptional regulator
MRETYDGRDPRKYVRLADKLRREIEDGTLAAREPIPAISRLAQEHQMSPATARRAMHALLAEDLIRYVPGHGYYVS